MEFNNYNKAPAKPEVDAADDGTTSKTKKKKSAGSTAVSAELAPSKQPTDQQLGTMDSLMRRLKGDKAVPKSQDVPLFGIEKPEKLVVTDANSVDSNEKHLSSQGTETKNKLADVSSTEITNAIDVNDPETDTFVASDQLENLSPAEANEAVREYTELRLHEMEGELHDLPLDAQPSQVAEAAATANLLNTIKANLQSDVESVDVALEAATNSTLRHIENNLPEVNNAEYDQTEVSNETIASAPGTTAELDPAADNDANYNAVYVGGNGNKPPEEPPSFTMESDDPPSLPPPVPVGYRQIPNPNAVAGLSAANTFAEQPAQAQVARTERSGTGSGLLVGLLVGNLIGRRRGRIKTEKRLLPVQRKLEKQITQLHDSVARKEQQIRTAVREKVAAITTANEQKRFAQTLTAERNTVVADQKAMAGLPEKPSNVASSETRLPVSRNVEAALIGSRAVSELVAAGAILTVASSGRRETMTISVAGEQTSEARIASINRSEMIKKGEREQRPVIRFDKKVEQFSRTELIQAAEKIKIEGVDLKEMLELGRINESGLRRIVGTFLEGGSVSEALSKEVREKELKFERDPRMKQIQDANRVQGGGGFGNSVLLPTALAAQNLGLSAMNMSLSKARPESPHPTPDKATLQRVRHQQIMTVGTTTLVLVGLILVALWITR